MRHLLVEFSRYFFVSLLGLAVDFSLLFVLTEYLGVFYLISATISFLAGLALVYYLSIKWVFKHRSMATPAAEFMMFLLIGLVGLVLNVLVLWLVTKYLAVYYLESKIVATGLVFSWNFAARKVLLFKQQSNLTINEHSN